MKLNLNIVALFLCLFVLSISSCSDSFEPSDILIDETNEELSVDDDDTSSDDDSNDDEDNSSDDDSDEDRDDSSDDDSNDGEEENDDESTEDDSGDDEEENGDGSSDDDDSTGDESDDENTDDQTDDETDEGDETDDGDNTDDDDTNDDAQPLIIGSWELVSATIADGRASTMVQNAGVVEFSFISSSKDENAQITFSGNPNTVNGSGQYTNVISYTLFGQAFTDESFLESPITNGTWQLENNNLTINGDEDVPSDYTIVELTANRMVLEVVFDRTIPVGELNVDATGTLVIVLNKM